MFLLGVLVPWWFGRFVALNEPTSSLRRAITRRISVLCWLLVLAGSQTVFAAGSVTLQLWGLPEQDMFAGIHQTITEYEHSHPGLHILLGTPGGQTEANDPQKMMTAFIAGKPPDLVYMDRFELAGWASRGVFLSLDSLYDRDKLDRADLYPAALAECTFEGKTYGLPTSMDARTLWVNMDVLEKFGYHRPPRDWDELAEMSRRITVRSANGQFETIGFAPTFGNAHLCMYAWLNGAEFATADGRRVTLDDPRIAEALGWMERTYAGIGGRKALEDFNSSSQLQGLAEPFLAGRLAMRIDGNWGLDYIAKYKPDMNFRCVPPPPPKGKPNASWSGGFCWSIPANAAHTEEAWALAKYLCSVEGWMRIGELQAVANAQRAAAEGLGKGYYIPLLSCSRKVNAANVDRFVSKLPKPVRDAYMAHVDLLPVCKFRPVIPVGRMLWDEHLRAQDEVLFGGAKPEVALASAQRRVQAELDHFYEARQIAAAPGRGRFDLARTFWIVFGGVIALIGAIWLAAASRWKWTPRTTGEARAGFLFASPWLLGFVVLMLGPMLASLLMAFTEYNMISPARWIGLGNFHKMLGFMRSPDGTPTPVDPLFYKSLANTALVTALGVPLGMIVSLGLALLVNREVRGVRIYRTLFYLPVVIPTVCTALLWMWLLNNETGVSGALLVPLLRKLGMEPISFFGDSRYCAIAMVLMLTWGAGGSMVIWLAGLKGIPRTYYEAAAIDGAGRAAQFFGVTLPMLSPYIFFNLVMGIIGWLQIFTQAYVITAPPPYGPNDSLLFYVVYLFVQGFQYFNMGIACAMAWILFVIVAMLTLFQFKLAPRWVHYDQ